jgi:hypothetical protein
VWTFRRQQSAVRPPVEAQKSDVSSPWSSERSEDRRQKSDEGSNMSNTKSERIESAKDLRVYKLAYELAMRIFGLTKEFPSEEKYALTSQIRRSSRSICLNLREAWAKRRYEAHFVSKITDCRRRKQRKRFGPGFRKRLWLHLDRATQTAHRTVRRDRPNAARND